MHFPPVIRHVLRNGLTLLVQRDPSYPLVAFHAVVRTGSATEGSYLGTGISHVVEHMLFKGTSRRPVGAIERESRSYGGTSQGFTSYDTTGYQLTVNAEFWSEGADLLIDALFFPTMDPEEFVKERDVVLRELKLGKDDPSHLVWEHLFAHAYRVHPYRIPIIGYEPLVTKLTREDLIAYHELHYRPQAMVIAVVGDLDPQAVIRRMEELCERIPAQRVPSPTVFPEEPLPSSPREVTEGAPSLSHAIVALGFPSVSLKEKDLFALDLLAWLLGGGRGSRLTVALKEKGLVHAVTASNYTPQERGLFVVTMRMERSLMDQALAGAYKELERVSLEPFSVSEMEAGKRAFLRSYLAGRQTAAGVAADVATFEMAMGDPAFAARYVEEVQKLSSADLQEVARRYLQPHRVTMVKLLPQGAVVLGAGQREELVEESRPKKVVLYNGLRVIMKRDPRLPLATLQVSFAGGVRWETEETNGLSSIVSRMFLRGTRKMSASTIAESQRALGIALESFSGRNACGLALEATSDKLPEAFDLLAHILMESTFPPGELEKEKRLALAQIEEREEDPFSWGLRRLMETLYEKHPYRLDPLGSGGSVSRLTQEDLIRFYHRLRDPRSMVISAVGDFDEEELLSWIKASFGRLSSPDGQSPSPQPEPPLKHLIERREVTPRQEGLVMVGLRGLSVTDPKVPVLDLMEMILSGGAGRLFTEVRERRGLAYTVGAYALHGIDPGAFVLYAVTDPKQVSAVRGALVEEIRHLNSVPVPEKELAIAKQGLLGAQRMHRQTQSAQAAQLGLDELYGLGFDYPAVYESRITAVSAADLQALAIALLSADRYVVVMGEPEPARESLDVSGLKKEEKEPLGVSR